MPSIENHLGDTNLFSLVILDFLSIEKIIEAFISTREVPYALGFFEWLKSQFFWIYRAN
jgi:hypothetical protein